jgi:microcystin-dependent protein
MPRNGSGTMAAATTFVAGATITASGHNTNATDFAAEITNSLAIDGQSTMTGAIKAANGDAATPSITFGSDTDTGLFRKGANIIGVSIAGTEIGTIGTTGFVGLGGTPIGFVGDYAGATAPTGWLLCYGQAVSRTTYAALFDVVSTTYGVGDGSTTFNIPDARGRVGVGKDNMGGSAANRITSAGCGIDGTALGAAGGLQTLQAHTHGLTAASAASDGAHTHTGTTGNQSADHSHTGSGTTSASGTHTHGYVKPVVVANAGNLGNDWSSSEAGNTDAGGDHTHTYSFTTSGVSANHTHTFTTASGGAHTHALSGDTDSTGTGASHGSVQPSIVFNKIIFAGA